MFGKCCIASSYNKREVGSLESEGVDCKRTVLVSVSLLHQTRIKLLSLII